MYGVGFTKHNTNAGFVDEDLHRITPQRVYDAFQRALLLEEFLPASEHA